MDAGTIRFDGCSFCFTGQLLDMKRSVAETETRARGGYTTKVVNDQLDYLVVGSAPSKAWKFGSYGTKIDAARRLRESNRRPEFLSEETFMEALAATPPNNSGAVDRKVVVVHLEWGVANRDADLQTQVARLTEQQRRLGSHVTARAFSAWLRQQLYDDKLASSLQPGDVIVLVRFVRQLDLSDDAKVFADEVRRQAESLGIPTGHLRWREKREGTASYIRLLRDVPADLQLDDG